jgi:acetolactate decarboxylase
VPDVAVKIPQSIRSALDDQASKSGLSVDAIVNLALPQYLNTTLHTVFQVSTSGALVAGVYDKEVSVRTILVGDPVVALGGAVPTSDALKQLHQTLDGSPC